MSNKYIGKAIKRLEDINILKGKEKYTDDIELPVKTYYVSFYRSPVAHGIIKKIDYSDALKLRGVVAVVTGEQLKGIKMGYWMHMRNMKEPERYPLALNKVKYYGQPIAAVIAEDKYVAEDALEYIQVDIEKLPPLTDPIKALNDKTVKVNEDMEDNIIYYGKYSTHDNLIELINKTSDIIINETLTYGRTIAFTLEPRAQLVWYDGDRLNIWATTQFPHVLRNYVAETLNFPENKIRVIAPRIGGGFGPKSAVFEDEMALYAIALKTGLPLKWAETRSEHLALTGHERDQIHEITAGFAKDGKIIGIYDKIIADIGAYGGWWTEIQPVLVAAVSLPGPYKFNYYGYEIYAVATNKAPMTPNIGFGRPVAAYVMERLLDIAAEKLNIDPVELRMRNLVDKSEFPYRNPANVVYDSGNYKEALELLLSISNYKQLREIQTNYYKEKGKYIGIGIATYSEYTAPSSLRLQQALGWEVGGYEKARVMIDVNGKVIVRLATQDTGQGHKTVFAQIVAEELGVSLEDVEVVEGDTDSTPYGFGTWASRSITTAGNAIIIASRKLREKVLRIASHLLKSNASNLIIENGVIYDREDPNKKISLKELAKIAYRMPAMLPTGENIGLEEEGVYDTPYDRAIVSYSWHLALIELDPETLQFKLVKYYVVDDAGVIINPMTAEGQIIGSTLAHGYFQAISGVKYDNEGNLLTSTMLQYTPPNIEEIPGEFIVKDIETPSPTPGGFKGLGEGGAIGGTAAVANAIADVLRQFNVKLTKIPINSNEIYNLIRAR
jgi:carbon-monoxide dehydrogenase large subunit